MLNEDLISKIYSFPQNAYIKKVILLFRPDEVSKKVDNRDETKGSKR
jgi:hypothetical protein